MAERSRHPLLPLRKGLGAFRRAFADARSHRNAVETARLEDLVVAGVEVKLDRFLRINGNASLFEILVIASIVANEKPARLLEIGTFDGNTTLQMALNSPAGATVYTLDLPEGAASTIREVDPNDWQYIRKPASFTRRYAGSAVEKKVVQRFGDSAEFDFGEFAAEGPLDFLFIDGSHSYDYVKNDTEKTLPLLKAGGCALWHDYTPHFPGVFRYLNELKDRLPLRWIEETRLVYYKKE